MLELAPGRAGDPVERGAHPGAGRTCDAAGDPGWSSL